MRVAAPDPNATPEEKKERDNLMKTAENQSDQAKKTEPSPEKKFLWMPMKYGIPVAIIGTAALAYAGYKLYKKYKNKQ